MNGQGPMDCVGESAGGGEPMNGQEPVDCVGESAVGFVE